MKILKMLLLLITLSIIHIDVFATPAAEFANLIKNMHSFSANFIQTTYDNNGKAIQQSQGKMALSRPGRFRWEVMHPIPQLIIANQTRLWIYDEDLAQVTIRPVKQVVGETPGLLLSHPDNNLEKDFTITILNKSAENKRSFLLIPKKSDNMFARINMSFNHGIIQEMKLYDHLGHMTRIVFKTVKINLALPDSLFIFKPSPTIDVIDETKR